MGPPRRKQLLTKKVLEKSREAIGRVNKTRITTNINNSSNNNNSSYNNNANYNQLAAETAVVSNLSNFINESCNNDFIDNGVGEDNMSSEKTKIRKPRHNSEAGKKLLALRARLREPYQKGGAEVPSDKPLSKGRKKGKKKKKKKGKQAATVTTVGQTANKGQSEALCYLSLWKKNREFWKFEKIKQIWLVRHALAGDLVDEEHFTWLLEYLASMKGGAKRNTLTAMKKLVDEVETTSADKVSEDKRREYDRARQIIQMLSEEDTDQ